jgi:hypothetical protein
MSQYQDRLASMDHDFQNARTPGELPPDGFYQCMVDRFDFIEAKTNGRLYLKTFLTVATGPDKGAEITTLHDLEDKDRMAGLKAHLQSLEIEPESLGHLEEALPGALDAIVEVTVFTAKSGNRYARVDRRHKDGLPRTSDIPYDDDAKHQPVTTISDGGGGAPIPW